MWTRGTVLLDQKTEKSVTEGAKWSKRTVPLVHFAALLIVLLLLCASTQAERWLPAEKNASRFQRLVSLLGEAVENGGADKEGIDGLLEEIRQEKEDDYEIARAVTDHWYAVMLDPAYEMYTWRDGDRAVELEQSGLDFSGKHAFVALGYQLDYGGEMKPELIGRCDAAAAAARSFPDSYVVTTGGATGGVDTNNHTEAGEMKKYLVKSGISKDRVFAEEKARTTLQNAEYSFRILRDLGIEKVTVVTSDYHQRWGQVVFNAVAAIYAQVTGYQVEIVGNYNFRAEPDNAGPESYVQITASQLSSVFRKGIGIYRPEEQTE